MTSSAADAQRLRDLARMRRVRDRIDREYAQPLDASVYRERAAHATEGMPACLAKQVTRPVRNREARAAEPAVA